MRPDIVCDLVGNEEVEQFLGSVDAVLDKLVSRVGEESGVELP